MNVSMGHWGSALKYTLLPGIFPRVRDFVGSGFAHLSFFMANVYRAVRLLPPSHPYLNPANRGRYGVWNVVAEARSNLVFKRQNIDQIIVFFSLLIGIILLAMQFGLLIMSVFVQSAWATNPVGAWWARFFVTRTPNDDLAFMTLDRIFGIEGIFNSKVAIADHDGPFPSPFHLGLQALFEYYSIGIFAIAILIIIYYVITLVGETAQSGQPFGRRFNGWAPARLMLCIALLAPISSGMNIAQLGTLRVAKWGSSLATNGWILFNETIVNGQTQLGEPASLIAIPNRPAMNTFAEWTMLAEVCRFMHEYIYARDVDYYVVRTAPENAALADVGPDFAPFINRSARPATPSMAARPARTAANYDAARNIAGQGTITVVVGELDPAYTRDRSGIRPVCGILAVEVLDAENQGVIDLQERYYQLVQEEISFSEDGAESVALRFTPTANKNPSAPGHLTTDYLRWVRSEIMQQMQQAINESRATIQNGCTTTSSTGTTGCTNWDDYGEKYGWAGAGMWYNKVAQYNGTFFEAVYNLPTPIRYPEAMEWVRERRGEEEEQIQPRDRYRPYRTDGDLENPSSAGAVQFRDANEMYIAQALYYVQTTWKEAYIPSEQNAILDYVNLVFGTSGLFNMRTNIIAGVHPLAALVGIGSSLVQSTIINLGGVALGGAMGGVGYMTNSTVLKTLGMAISGISFKIALLGLSVGFILFYVLPFLPFLYFTFAFGGWIKAVFEAMVGLPLWALAHLKIDGEGMNGPMAMDGFFLVLEIFVRPIVIVIALISSVSIFSALVTALNSIWDLVITNLTGHTQVNELAEWGGDLKNGVQGTGVAERYPVTTGTMESLRNTVDFLFYTVLYAIVVYIMGLSCFKMIDLVPNYVLRWMGKGLKTIGEGELSEDPGQGILRNVSMGSAAVVDKFSGSSNTMMQLLAGRK